jgi:lipid II:glycine glycyltransferase (peptidoglycan interpeptide bridge formation enzyme)
VWEVFSPSKGVRVFTAKLSGKPVAAEFVFLHKKTGELMWVASKRLENDLGAGQLLHWAIIRWLKENGFASYDLGGVPPSRETLPGIYFHKESLGGEHIELAGEYEIEHGGWRTLFWNFCARIRGKIK